MVSASKALVIGFSLKPLNFFRRSLTKKMIKNLQIKPILKIVFVLVALPLAAVSQNHFDKSDSAKGLKKALQIKEKAIGKLGGNKYLQIKNSVGKGRFSLLRKGVISSFQSFVDVIVYPNKERTDFKEQGSKTVQVNFGDKGWVFKEHLESFRDQVDREIKNFKRSLRAHYNFLLREKWANEATLSYVGRRRASLGKRNDVVKLTFKNGLEVEYEFSDEGLPMKTIYKRFDSDKKEIVEEERYARFIDVQGVLIPYIIDHYTNDEHAFRVSYESFEYNKRIPDSIFLKPDNPKKLKKKLKL